jgi:hypothetical protein
LNQYAKMKRLAKQGCAPFPTGIITSSPRDIAFLTLVGAQ